MSSDPVVTALVARAAAGDPGAWNGIVERYAPLVWAICARHRLNGQDTKDLGQNVWLLLVEKIGTIREPAALPGWLATTTHRECLRVLRAAHRDEHAELPPDDQTPPGDAGPSIEDEILAAERDAALRAALAELPGKHRKLLLLLISDPPRSYAEISATMDIPIGSIGPTRARLLKQLRESTHLRGIAAGADWDTEKLLRREVSVVTDGWIAAEGLSDDALLAALRRAVSARQAVPEDFMRTARNAFAWHNIDAELAQLTYDSVHRPADAAPTRSEPASIRALTFTGAQLTIELEVTADSVVGQVVPALVATIEVQTRADPDVVVETDEIGCFSIQPIPGGPFRLRVRAGLGADVLTGWITL